jgi:hypothetical protein
MSLRITWPRNKTVWGDGLPHMWAAIEEDPTLSAAALARKAYGSFATAWHVRRDFELVGHG